MTSTEIRRMSNTEFFEHMAEVYALIDRQMSYLETPYHYYFSVFPQLQERHENKMLIKEAALKRLERWAARLLAERSAQICLR